MPDTTIKKVEADFSPKGEMGQRYLVAGSLPNLSMSAIGSEADVKDARSIVR